MPDASSATNAKAGVGTFDEEAPTGETPDAVVVTPCIIQCPGIVASNPAQKEKAPDSDQEGDSANLDRHTISKRNSHSIAKYSVRPQGTKDPENVLGLFAEKQLPKNHALPVKGPWFSTVDGALKFAATCPEAKLHERIVKVDYAAEDDPDSIGGSMYKVMTELAGFTNHYVGRALKPNAEFQFVDGGGLGDHALKIVTTRQVKTGVEITVHYGFLMKLTAAGELKVAEFKADAKCIKNKLPKKKKETKATVTGDNGLVVGQSCKA